LHENNAGAYVAQNKGVSVPRGEGPGLEVLDKMGGRFHHASAATGGAKPSAFTGEGHQLFMGAFPTPQAQKPMG